MRCCPTCKQPLQNTTNSAIAELWFADFWAIYPLKKAKKDAEKAWSKEPDKASMAAGLALQLPMMLKNPKYIPYAATWIRGRRWEDQVHTFENAPENRVIACELCGDTGIYLDSRLAPQGRIPHYARCVCIRGHLPGLLIPSEASDAP